jgi:hypothetical protein
MFRSTAGSGAEFGFGRCFCWWEPLFPKESAIVFLDYLLIFLYIPTWFSFGKSTPEKAAIS